MPDQQEKFVKAEPKVFVPAKGKWGERGATCVRLKSAKAATVRKAMREAWLNAAPKSLAKKFQDA
jgi:hypothetical protein